MSATKKTPKSGAKKTVKKHVSAKPADAQASATTVASQKWILLVEDEAPLAHALEMKLKNDGYGVKTVANGSDALSEAKKGTYSIMLLDLIMPLMDGFSVLTELKSRKNSMPIIVLSNLGQEEDRAKAKDLGALDYFVKSNTPISDIIARVKQVI